MCRVMSDNEITRHMKQSMADTWLPRILSFSQMSEKSSTKQLLEEMDAAIASAQLTQAGKVL